MKSKEYEDTQNQLKLQEQLETLSRDVIIGVEALKSSGIGLILSNDFEGAIEAIERLNAISVTLGKEI